jgi:DNA polymerase
MQIHADIESFSACDIKGCGGHRYAWDVSTELLCLGLAVDDQEVVIWIHPQWHASLPWYTQAEYEKSVSIFNLMQNPNALVFAHNATGFEVPMCDALMLKTTGFPAPQHHQWRCTAAMARRASLPASLEKCAEALKLSQQKDKKGAALIRRFCIPQKDGSRILPTDDPEGFKALCDYCKTDVSVERLIHKTLKHFELTGFALETFQADLRMNCRGLPVNLPALRNAQALVEEASEGIARDFKAITGFNHSQGKMLIKWLKEKGYKGKNLQALTVEAELESDDFDPTTDWGRALLLKKMISYASLKKIPTMINSAGPHDNKVRGGFIYHGAGTGRWSATLIQPQNLKRPTIKHTEMAYADICKGASSDMIELVYGPVLEVVSSCIRHFIQDTHPFFNADYAAIEARIVCWLAGQEDALEEYRKNIDRYVRMAAVVFSKPEKDINKHPERFIGKQTILGCIAEGELVLTDYGLISIEQVQCWHRVWDGVEWVNHEGVIYKGEREVITYQGLTATPDHEVFICTGTGLPRTTHFGGARQHKQRLQISGEGRTAIRTMESGEPECLSEITNAVGPVYQGQVHRMWHRSFQGRTYDLKWQESGVQSLCTQGQNMVHLTSVVDSPHGGSTSEMSEPCSAEVSGLRRPRYRVPVQECLPWSDVGGEKFGAPSAHGVRPDQQRRPLRAGESAIRNSWAADGQYQIQCRTQQVCVPSEGVAIQRTSSPHLFRKRVGPKTDSFESKGVDSQQEERVEKVRRVVRVYDILNAGPRHRFTVSNVLVHNCGFQMSGPKFRITCEKFGYYDLPKGLEFTAVEAFRSKHKKIVSLWYDTDAAARNAILCPGKKFKAGRLTFFTASTAGLSYLFLVLPSGRKLAYPKPAIEPMLRWTYKGEMRQVINPTREDIATALKQDPDGYSLRDSITFWGKHPTRTSWERLSTYGAKLVENGTQAVAADIMANGTIKAEREGFLPAALIHDESVTYHTHGRTIDEFIACLTDLPPWADGLPIEAEGDLIPFYKK